MKLSLISILMLALAAQALPATNSACQATIASDVQAVTASLSAIAAQAKAQQFPQAVEKLADDLAVLIPTLSAPDRALVEKFVTDLQAAVDPAGPGGSTVTSVERLKLSNDLLALLTSTGLTSAQIQLILDDLAAISASLEGVSAAQLKADLQRLATDIQACWAAR